MAKIKKPKIKYVEYGLANCSSEGNDKWIELNENLKKYPKLKNKILEHELKHYYSKGKLDFMIEMKGIFNMEEQKEVYKFMWEHPETFSQLLPFILNKRGFFPNYFALFYYLVVIGLIVILLVV